MEGKKNAVLPPIYDRPGNLIRKMALLERHILVPAGGNKERVRQAQGSL